ncbi:putative fatty acyl-CoA reductase CG5065 [Ischnura elegans]|uniref:putative fatty acyl-CoA reductase CG5065 n=1 Tax=Ischnura elegans TaxID=197161 RepID=UPI001ED8B83F|nr:putative fatty acyl-CoA reductase CG5065 [Ischnura elegans]
MSGGKKPSVAQVFQGQSVLVSGATGFVGKVLLEKLLRCCPGVGRIYLIVRPKRGNSLKERVKDLLENTFFDRCRSERGSINWCCGSAEVAATEDDKKGPLVVAIHGDVSEKGLGLDEKDRTHLELHVTYVIHSAATVRFNESLRQAVFLNVRGTREMLELASRMPLLKAFVHVSTAYAHVSNHNSTIEERFYSVPAEPEVVIKAAEEMEEDEFEEVSKKIAETYHNTYLCTKALAERMIEKDYSHLPVCVYRPGIVLAVHKSPVPGYAERNQGPAIVISSCACGMFGNVYCAGEVKPEIVPVDHVVNAVMVIIWSMITDRSNKTVNGVKNDIRIYNHVSSKHSDLTWTKFRLTTNDSLRSCPETNWLSEMEFTSSYMSYEFSSYLRYVFSKLMDVLNHMRGEKSTVAEVHQKAKNGLDTLCYFMVNQFKFSDDGLRTLRERFLKEASGDGSGYTLSEFDFDITAVEWRSYVRCYADTIRDDLMTYFGDKVKTSLQNARRFKAIEKSLKLSGFILSSVGIYYLGLYLDWML